MCQSIFLFKIHKKQFFHEMHKGGCTILCSPPDLYGTSDGWGLLWQGISTSLLVWSLGLSLYLSLPVPNLELIFLVCAAAQVLVILWELFRRFLANK